MPLRRVPVILLLPVLFMLGAAPASAQSAFQPPRLLLKGRVLDPDGAAIGAARVIVMPRDRPAEMSAATDERGEFALEVEPGAYTITIAKPGFATTTENVIVAEGATDIREFSLSVAAIREDVTVNASAGYHVAAIISGTKTSTPLRDVPQAVTVVTQELIKDQLMSSVSDVVRYVPGITAHQGENNRDQVIIRGNSSSADFFLNGVRDDVQYYRDLYNLDRVEALKGPNAMIFGRGGGGGVINRVTKEAGFMPLRELTFLGGSYDNKRFAADLNQPLGQSAAFRINTMGERSGSFRRSVDLERYGINPTLTLMPTGRTMLTLAYEHFNDSRVADRGIPSFQGRPADVDIASYFGNPRDSHVDARVNVASASIEHQTTSVTIRNRTLIGDYDRGYQNYVPGAVTSDKTLVALSAYNNHTQRLNVFNQTDVTFALSSGTVHHTLLAGAEIGRQLTDNLRNTGYFNNTVTSILVPYTDSIIDTPVTYRQSATDADNHLITNVAALYAQDQIELSPFVQVIGGLRFDRFDLQYHNNRTGDDLTRTDGLLSPRAGVVVKPRPQVSLYGSYTVSYLPSSGDQFASLTNITQQVKPEKFSNYEVGTKWDARANLSFTAAVYRLNRTNTRATDPNDPTRILQTGGQRTNGFEIGVNGRMMRRWQIAGGYAYQDAFVTSATTAARAGARVAQVPHHAVSLWNLYQVHPRIGTGVGVVYRTDMFAAIDNTVTLPGYADVDASVYLSLSPRTRLQLNVENLFDTRFYANADSNTNISPGLPRAAKVALITRF